MADRSEVPEFDDFDPNALYVDQVRIVYHSTKHWTEPEPLATVVLIVDGGTTIDREQLRHEVEDLHVNHDLEDPPRDGFTYSDQLNKHSWGASGATLQIVVYAAASMVGSGIIGGAAWDGLKAISRRVGAMHGTDGRTDALSERSAQMRARQMVAAAFPEIANDLTILAVTLDGASATVVLKATDGSTITAKPSMTDGGAIGPITRAYPEQSP